MGLKGFHWLYLAPFFVLVNAERSILSNTYLDLVKFFKLYIWPAIKVFSYVIWASVTFFFVILLTRLLSTNTDFKKGGVEIFHACSENFIFP